MLLEWIQPVSLWTKLTGYTPLMDCTHLSLRKIGWHAVAPSFLISSFPFHLEKPDFSSGDLSTHNSLQSEYACTTECIWYRLIYRFLRRWLLKLLPSCQSQSWAKSRWVKGKSACWVEDIGLCQTYSHPLVTRCCHTLNSAESETLIKFKQDIQNSAHVLLSGRKSSYRDLSGLL